MKSKLLYARFFLMLIVLIPLFSQVSSDPDDFFYTDLDRWEIRGLVYNLPLSRPYPLQMVKEILQTVINRGDHSERHVALDHYNRVFSRSFYPGVRSEAGYETFSGNKQLGAALALDVNSLVNENLGISASFDFWGINRLPDTEILPANSLSSKDLIKDQVKVGPLYILPAINSSFSIGNSEYYAQAGLMRGSWGPIHSNSLILSSDAFHTGQYSIVLNKEKWGFDTALYSLVATSIDEPFDFNPQKYLAVHSIDWRPYPWFSLNIFETVIYGNRFEPLYLLPFSVYFVSQGLVGFEDNSMIGGSFTVRPRDGIKLDGVFYMDDMGFTDIVTFQKTQKWRIAGQLAAAWTPQIHPMLRVIQSDYTMVTPYTFSHKDSNDLDNSAPNYHNYVHAGTSLGSTLQPNSDRLNLSVTVSPLERVDVDIFGTLIRHGNVNEDLEQRWVREYVTGTLGYVTDGSVNNSSYTDTGHANNHKTSFLTQDTIQYIFQTGFNLKCRLPVLKTGGYILFKLGYQFELNQNPGINDQLYTKSVLPVYDPETSTPAETAAVDAEVAAQYAKWKDQATERQINNYIMLGIEYFY